MPEAFAEKSRAPLGGQGDSKKLATTQIKITSFSGVPADEKVAEYVNFFRNIDKKFPLVMLFVSEFDG